MESPPASEYPGVAHMHEDAPHTLPHGVVHRTECDGVDEHTLSTVRVHANVSCGYYNTHVLNS